MINSINTMSHNVFMFWNQEPSMSNKYIGEFKYRELNGTIQRLKHLIKKLQKHSDQPEWKNDWPMISSIERAIDSLEDELIDLRKEIIEKIMEEKQTQLKLEMEEAIQEAEILYNH